MGGDGGSFCKRNEQVKLKKTAAQWEDNPDAIRRDLYSRCALTKNKLEKPVVVCGMGNLYNKQTVIEHCLEPINKDYAYSHLRSLKHVIDVKAQSEKDEENGILKFTCPITGRLLAGTYKFVVMRNCGCLLSLDALQRVGAEENKCAVCYTPYEDNKTEQYSYYIPLFPDQAVKDILLDRILTQRQAEKEAKLAAKAAKKKAKKEAAAVVTESVIVEKTDTPLTKEELKAERKLAKKLKRKEDKIKARMEDQQIKKQKLGGEEKEDPRAKYDPRFKSKVFASMFIPHGVSSNRTDIQFLAGVSTKAISTGFIT